MKKLLACLLGLTLAGVLHAQAAPHGRAVPATGKPLPGTVSAAQTGNGHQAPVQPAAGNAAGTATGNTNTNCPAGTSPQAGTGGRCFARPTASAQM